MEGTNYQEDMNENINQEELDKETKKYIESCFKHIQDEIINIKNLLGIDIN